ncbi:hypothetical protein P4O66_012764 [Electrophorus voltai]|uniref:Reverse transcriptase domain-containing protein n=1 Tax=Electrophorus voltai TaxID=2609070 RepID=A0AAD8Z5F8_9TELE|nr:hypothetical protein P4O66_012764 [Electrophorus voltai]
MPELHTVQFSNQKPWLDRTIRAALNSRTAAHNAGIISGNTDEYKSAAYGVRRAVREAKRRYGRKLETQLQQSGSRSLWQGLRMITDYRSPPSGPMSADESLANELNTFFARFEATSSSANANGANASSANANGANANSASASSANANGASANSANANSASASSANANGASANSANANSASASSANANGASANSANANSASASSANANGASANGTIGAANGTCAGPTIEQRPLIIAESDVRGVFKRVNTRKAMGPDGICGRVLKACADQLPRFKRSTIVPVPKKPRPSDLNDYRPVALTSVVMKCFEKLVRDFITSSLPASTDPLQFAYHHNRSTDDAIAHLLHTTLAHLDEGRGNYVKILFVDYSSAFNTIIPSLLTTKLEDLGLHTSLCDWISNFLTDRPQSVRVGNCASSTLTLSTGAPQGCVLSPLLYSLYTYDCTATSSSTIIVKFADDTVVVGLISDNDERAYLEEIKHLENWCQENNLLLNVSKTKELIVDCSKKQERHYQPVRISGTTVERVDSFRRLRDFRLPSKVLRNFYTCTIESILTGNITVWFGNSTKQDRQALQRVVRSAERITHSELPDLQTTYYKRCQTKARKIVKDPTHPNNRLFSLLSIAVLLFSSREQLLSLMVEGVFSTDLTLEKQLSGTNPSAFNHLHTLRCSRPHVAVCKSQDFSATAAEAGKSIPLAHLDRSVGSRGLPQSLVAQATPSHGGANHREGQAGVGGVEIVRYPRHVLGAGSCPTLPDEQKMEPETSKAQNPFQRVRPCQSSPDELSHPYLLGVELFTFTSAAAHEKH